MKVIPFLLLILMLSAMTALAQRDPSTAAVSWERYLDSGAKISVNLPKMPLRLENFDPCRELERDTHYAYAEGAVYEFTVVYRKKNSAPCRMKVPFNDATLNDRLNEIRNQKMGPRPPSIGAGVSSMTGQAVSEQSEQVVGISSYKFESGTTTRWVIPEMSKSRWVELAVYHRAEAKTDASSFIESLSFDSKEGKDIGDGAAMTIGDINVKTDVFSDLKANDPTTERQQVIAKPRATYSELARQHRVQGTVRLKVPLLADGTIGKIEIVNSLEYGLTEQSIAAARKIVFIPKSVNGSPVSVVVTIEYGFNIY